MGHSQYKEAIIKNFEFHKNYIELGYLSKNIGENLFNDFVKNVLDNAFDNDEISYLEYKRLNEFAYILCKSYMEV